MAWVPCFRGTVICGISLGMGKAGKSFPQIYQDCWEGRIKKAGPGFETSGGLCSGGVSLWETYVWGQSLEESPEYCTINCRQHSELDSRKVLGIFKIRSQSDAAGRNSKRFAQQVASLRCHYSQMKCVSMCQLIPFWFFKRMGRCLLVLRTGRGGYLEKNLSSRMHVQRTKVP